MSKSSTDYLIRKGSVITVITLVSRPLGYVREAVQAYLFGATLLVDAFVIAFNFPEMVQTLFFSGATSAFLIPVCSRYLDEPEEFSRIYSLFINLAILVTVVVSLGFLVLSGPITSVIAPGLSAEGKTAARWLFVIMIPVISCHAILSVMKAFLNAKEQFAAPELSGVLWNLIFIIFAVALGRRLGIYALGLGVSIGAFGQVFFQIPYLRRNGISYTPFLSFAHPSLTEAKRLFTGALIGTSIVPINSFVGRVVASFLPAGEVSSLAYAFRIFILPFSLFAVPTYTVLFSRISALYHDKDRAGMAAHIDSSIVLLIVTLLPSTIFLCLNGDAFVQILYQRGAFTVRDSTATARALAGYSAGLLFYALSISLVRVFNAFHDVMTPAIVGMTSVILNALLACLLMGPLGNLGVSLAISLSSLYYFIVLAVLLHRRTRYSPSARTWRQIVRACFAGLLYAALLFFFGWLLPGRTYLLFCLGLVAALGVYGALFSDYLVDAYRRRRR